MIINSIIAGAGASTGNVFPNTNGIWANYGISSANGSKNSNTTRLTSVGFTAIKNIKILNNADYEFSLFAFRLNVSTNTLSYTGCWDGTDYITSSATWFDSLDLDTTNTASDIKSYNRNIFQIVMRRKSDPSLDIANAEADNIEITVYP